MPVTPNLERFHPLVSRWFENRVGDPTDIQRKAWSLIASGEHCLVSAATGSGKTLAAFLWAISQLAAGKWELGQTRVLYVSPLKALNNDIRRNLLTPLQELRDGFRQEGVEWPDIRVMTRSGDTEQGDRRKMLRHPPEILITTPESLNLLLTSKDGQRALAGIRSVILDEIHSVVGSKRGVYLMTGLERLAHLNGEFQRIALSATVRPMELVARYVGGFRGGVARPVRLAESSEQKRYEIEVRFPEAASREGDDDDFWRPIVQDLKELIAKNESTLVFVNSRKLCEKIAYKINEGEPAAIAYSHHGSLSKEIRFAVEQRLKNGELKAIVATNSLEMGIDVGALDCVVMVQCPGLISSAVQKVGRSGHQVGATSRAIVFPSHARDFLESAVLSESIRERDIEEVRPVEAPLDVLAQVIVSTLGAGSWDLDELFALAHCSYPYRRLSRELFDLVINMLAGRYAGSRLRELKPRVAIDRARNTATLRKGALMAFYFSGGVIPDRGYFHLRHAGNGSRIGELDEEFVWERTVGDVFTLGVQSWRIDQITHNDVLVSPARSGDVAPPFWRAETFDRDFHYSNRIGVFLEWANERLEDSDFVIQLQERFRMDAMASNALADFLTRQKLATGKDLPHRRHVLAEIIDAAPQGAPGRQLVLHTHWGGRVNRPYAMALDAAWKEAFGSRTDIYVNNDCVVVALSDEVAVDEVIGLVDPGNLDTLLRKRLEGSGFFGARFREAAGTALLVTRNRAGQRLPLWLSRLRAKKLFESVQAFDDFPLLLEAWRCCLKDEFDMESLRLVLGELERGDVSVSVARASKPSPFAASVAWRQINDEYMYANDNPEASGESKLREDLVKAVAFDEANRPRIGRELIEAFEAKRKRLADGYAPSDRLELQECLRDRIAIPVGEWSRLQREQGGGLCVGEALGHVFLEDERERFERLFCQAPDGELLREYLSYFGPVSLSSLATILPCSGKTVTSLIEEMEEERLVVVGHLVEGEEERFVCEAENFEILLRMRRARDRMQFEPLPLERLGLFLATWQGVARVREASDPIRDALDKLLCWAGRVEEWDAALLKCRVAQYSRNRLDAELLEDGALWYGASEGKVGFCLPEDWDLVGGFAGVESDRLQGQLLDLFSSGGCYAFQKLREVLGCGALELEEALWGLVWSGRVSNDAFVAARKGAAAKYQLCQRDQGRLAGTRGGRRGNRLRGARPVAYPGNWYVLPEQASDLDAVEQIDLEKERARVLLDRYGVVFRELLAREQEAFRWKSVFRAFRLLELSGEVVGGRFFDGIDGLQFASKAALRSLRAPMLDTAIYWLSATDPASLCGVDLEPLKGELPKRLTSTRLIFRGRKLVCEALRGGRALVFHVQDNDEDLEQILGVLSEALGIARTSQLKIESINGVDARRSLYLESLDTIWRLHRDHKQVVVEGLLCDRRRLPAELPHGSAD